LLARLRSGNYGAGDLGSIERLASSHDPSDRLRRDQVVDALIIGLDRQQYHSQEYSHAIGILVAAGSDERTMAAFNRLAGSDKRPLLRVDAAEALARLGDDSGVDSLTAAMRDMEDEGDLSYAASRLRALKRSSTSLEVLLDIASDATADGWTRAQAAVVATAYDSGDAAVEMLKNLAEAFKEPAVSRYLAQALDSWEAIRSLRDSGLEGQATDLGLRLAYDRLARGRRHSSITIAAAIEASRSEPHQDVSRLLVRLAEDTEVEIGDSGPVDAAVEAGRLGALTEAIQLLRQWGADHGRGGTARLAAAKGLERLGQPDIAWLLLSDLADDEDVAPPVRASAALQRELTRPNSAARYPIEMLAGRFATLARDRTATPDERMEALRGLKALNRRSDARRAAGGLVEDPELGETARLVALGEFDENALSSSEAKLLLTTAKNNLNGSQLRFQAIRVLMQAGMTREATPALRALAVHGGHNAQKTAIGLMRDLALADDLAEVCREEVGLTIAEEAITALVAVGAFDRIRQLNSDRAAPADARLCAAEALLSDGDESGRQTLRDLALGEADPDRMAQAAYALNRLGASAEAAFALRVRATDENAAADLRVEAIRSLTALDVSARASSHTDLVEIAHDIAAREETASATRLQAAELLITLGDRPQALETLVAVMTSPAVDPGTRLHVAGRAAEVGGLPQPSCETLAELAQSREVATDTRSRTRALAVRLGCPAAAAMLTSAMQDPALGYNERLEAAILAFDLGIPRAGSILTSLTIHILSGRSSANFDWRDGDYQIVDQAMKALARHSNCGSLIEIASAPEAPDPSRDMALRRLAEVGVEHLTTVAADDLADPNLRASAALAAWNHGVRGALVTTLLHIAGDHRVSLGNRIQAAKAAGDGDASRAAQDSLISLLNEDGLSDSAAFAAAVFADMATKDAVLDVAQASSTAIAARLWLAAWALPKLGFIEEARSLLVELGSASNIDCGEKIEIAVDYLPRLGRTSAGVKILLDLTRSDQIGPEQLDAVSAALTKIAPTDVLASLAVDAPNDSIRCAAAEGLWRRGRRQAAVDVLLEMAGRNTMTPQARVRACRALIKAGSPEAATIGEQLLLDPSLDEALRAELLNDLLMVEY